MKILGRGWGKGMGFELPFLKLFEWVALFLTGCLSKQKVFLIFWIYQNFPARCLNMLDAGYYCVWRASRQITSLSL